MLFYEDQNCRIDISSRTVPEGQEVTVVCSDHEMNILSWEKFIASRPAEALKGLRFIKEHMKEATR